MNIFRVCADLKTVGVIGSGGQCTKGIGVRTRPYPIVLVKQLILKTHGRILGKRYRIVEKRENV